VSPSGSDSNSGSTASSPFKTIAKAQSVIRGINSNMSGDIVVNLASGTYLQTSPLTFMSADSGTNGHNVIYQAASGAVPLISGGQTITGWSLHDSTKNIWQATVGTSLQTRQLYVNGWRANRTTNVSPNLFSSSSGIPGTSVTQTSTGYTTNDTSMLSWGNPSDIEFVYQGGYRKDWSEARVPVASITSSGGLTVITMKTPAYTDNRAASKCWIDLPTRIENAYELMANSGDWYLNRSTGIIYYIPRSGEDMSTANVVAPTLQTLVSATNTNHLEFIGLSFEYATWLEPNSADGYLHNQADNYVATVNGSPTWVFAPGNVEFSGCNNCLIQNCVFTHLGAEGVAFENGSQNNTVIGSCFQDISGNGIRIGNSYYPTATGSAQDINNTVKDNLIDHVACEYHGAVGICAGYVAYNTISHNEIENLPYTGISVGWGGWWNTTSYMQSNVTDHNYIHDYLQLLMDGGAIYTLNGQGVNNTTGRSSIHDNFALNQPYFKGGVLYPDESSGFEDWYNNVVQNCSASDWFLAWIGTCHDDTATFNYTDTAAYDNSGTNVTVSNTYTSGFPWPVAATAIMQNAGLESAYTSIKKNVPVDLALNMPTTASSALDSTTLPSKANDGNANMNDPAGKGGWAPSSSDNSPWWQVDLGNPYRIGAVELDTRVNSPFDAETRHNFLVLGSNDPTFSTYSTLGSQGSTPLQAGGIWLGIVTDANSYRYVRVSKSSADFFIAELRVYGAIGSQPFSPLKNGVYKFVDVPGYALDDPNGAGSGTGIDLRTYSGANQQWTVTSVGNGRYEIQAANGYALTGSAPSSQLTLTPFTGASNQLWTIQPDGGTYCNVVNVATGQGMDDSGGGNGGTVGQRDMGSDNTNRDWTITAVSAAPFAPTGLAAAAGNGHITLRWSGSSGATSYNVYRGASSGGESTTPIATGVTAADYKDTGLTNGTAYYYEVVAVGGSGTSGFSNEASATPAPPFANGTYKFLDRAGYALDDSPGTKAAQATFSGANQTWTVRLVSGDEHANANEYEITASNGLALTGSTIYGQLTLDSYAGARKQLWTISANGQYWNVTNIGTGQNMDDWWGGSGQVVGQWTASTSNSNQDWAITPVSTPPLANGTYKFLDRAGYALDDSLGTKADQVTFSGTNQSWTLTLVSGNQYKITGSNGLALTGATAGSQLTLESYTGASNQLWNITINGWYWNVTNVGTGQNMDDWGGGSGQAVGQWTATSNSNQDWAIQPID
jgi:hypothetical protein